MLTYDGNGYPVKELRLAIQDACRRVMPKKAIELAAEYMSAVAYGSAVVVWLDDEDNIAPTAHGKPAMRFTTGGWSGCEEVINWLEDEPLTRYFWVSSRRGGEHIYELKEFNPATRSD